MSARLEIKSQVSPDTIAAYKSALYSFRLPGGHVHFRVGRRCPTLEAVIRDSRGPGAFYITAHNPRGQLLKGEQNDAASQSLEVALQGDRSIVWPATGEDPAGHWPPEPGFLVMGLGLPAAEVLGIRFEQNATVWVGVQGLPELVLLR